MKIINLTSQPVTDLGANITYLASEDPARIWWESDKYTLWNGTIIKYRRITSTENIHPSTIGVLYIVDYEVINHFKDRTDFIRPGETVYDEDGFTIVGFNCFINY